MQVMPGDSIIPSNMFATLCEQGHVIAQFCCVAAVSFLPGRELTALSISVNLFWAPERKYRAHNSASIRGRFVVDCDNHVT